MAGKVVRRSLMLILCLRCATYINIHNILGTFGYNRDLNFNITKHEEELVKQYRRNPKLQKAVDKLLDIE